MSIYDVEASALIKQVAELLKKDSRMKAPEWSNFVKTGVSKERPPVEPDWWYTRAASMLRKISILGPIGTEKLRRHYGSKKNRGSEPQKFFKGSGSVTRAVLQQFEEIGLVTQSNKGLRKGRILTPAGIKILSLAAKNAQGKE